MAPQYYYEDLPTHVIIVGTGGFGRELFYYLKETYQYAGQEEPIIGFAVSDDYFEEEEVFGRVVRKLSEVDLGKYHLLIGVADPVDRKNVVRKLGKEARYFTLVHPTAYVSDSAELGIGSIIAPNATVSIETVLGKHSQINYGSTIGHDTKAGEYFTTAPSVNISGNCQIGKRIYFGTNSSIRQGIKVCDDVIFGMGAVVLRDVAEPGVYVGIPAEKLLR